MLTTIEHFLRVLWSIRTLYYFTMMHERSDMIYYITEGNLCSVLE